MIYDRGPVSICTLSAGTPLRGTLSVVSAHLFHEDEVYHRRYWEGVQAGSRIDRLIRVPWGAEITADHYALLDGHVYKIVQAQHGLDDLGLPQTTLSLERKEGNYDIASPD